jgi:hypothetical protein
MANHVVALFGIVVMRPIEPRVTLDPDHDLILIQVKKSLAPGPARSARQASRRHSAAAGTFGASGVSRGRAPGRSLSRIAWNIT